MIKVNHGYYDKKQKAELTKRNHPSAARPSLSFKTRRFPSPSCEGFGFIENYLDTSTDIMTCQFFSMGILRVCANEFGLKIDELLRMETLRDTRRISY
jgi:hypothetical protein